MRPSIALCAVLVAVCLLDSALAVSVRTMQRSRSGEEAPSVVVDPRGNPALGNTTIVVHLVNDNDGRIPSAPPQPPQAMPAAPLGGQMAGFGGGFGMGGFGGSSVGGMQLLPAASLITPGQAPFQQDLQPSPLSVTTPSADLLPSSSITPRTAPISPDSVGTYAVQTVAGVRIVGEEETGKGCQCQSNPCRCRISPTEQIEAALDRVKSEIVVQAQKVQQENRWMRTVKKIIKHYEEKIKRVSTHVDKMKGDIKKLFGKKKHYEDLLLQYHLDQENLKKVAQEKEWKKNKEEEKRGAKFEAQCNKLRNPNGCSQLQ